MNELIYKGWYDGGTFITNFDDDERPLYEAAIKESGEQLVISDQPMPPKTWGCSLHCLRDLRGPNNGLSDFWRIFDELKKKQLVSVSAE